MPLLPELDALTIKRLNQGEVSLDKLPTPDLGEILLATEPVGSSEGSGIYRVTNRLEVILNIHQWNKDMASEEPAPHGAAGVFAISSTTAAPTSSPLEIRGLHPDSESTVTGRTSPLQPGHDRPGLLEDSP